MLKILGRIFCVIVIILGAFSTAWLIDTFTAESYQYGTTGEVSSNLIFIISTETMVFPGDDSKIEKQFESIYQVNSEFDTSKYSYEFTMNGEPVANTKIDNGQILLEMSTTFLNTTGEDILSDTLKLQLDFFSDKTRMIIETQNKEAVPYWNAFFNSYGFDLRVYKTI